jgi:hypothetical protein
MALISMYASEEVGEITRDKLLQFAGSHGVQHFEIYTDHKGDVWIEPLKYLPIPKTF